MSKKRKIIGSVHKALEILELFDRHTPELGTTEIARALSLPKSTAAGLIATLERSSYLEQNPETRKYHLGYKLAERAGVFLDQYDLRQVALPLIEQLSQDCNESVNLAIRDGGYMVYIERVHGPKMLGMRSEIGKRERIHSTALGKAVLASLSDQDVAEFAARYDFIPLTPRTITSSAAFVAELHRTRQRGYAVDDEENELGGRCVAAPIFDYQGRPFAALSLSVPLQRLPVSQFPVLGKQVQHAAEEISRKLGAPEQRGMA